MRNAQKFRNMLQSGRKCLGVSIGFTDPRVSDALGDSTDFFWLDLEHYTMSCEAAAGHILAAAARGVPLLARVPYAHVGFIKPLIDGGVDGIIAPQIYSAQDARAVVDACRYPPLGKRGYGPRVPSDYGRVGGAAYMRRANDELFVSVQIETREAFEALDAITDVEGLDCLVIGPYDLSVALGVPGQMQSPILEHAMDTIIQSAKRKSLSVGAGFGIHAPFVRTWLDRGVDWAHVGCDYDHMIASVDGVFRAVRGNIGE